MLGVAHVLRAFIPVIAKAVVRIVDAHVVFFIAEIIRALDGIVAIHLVIDAPLNRVAPLVCRAEKVINAERIVRLVHTGIELFIAAILRAVDAVIAVRRRFRPAPALRIAEFRAIAENAIVAERVVGLVHTSIYILIAGILRAVDAVIAIGGCPGNAAEDNVAYLRAVAEKTVIAERVVGLAHASIEVFVAAVLRAVHAVVAIGRFTRTADKVDAKLFAVTEDAVVALGIVGAT